MAFGVGSAIAHQAVGAATGAMFGGEEDGDSGEPPADTGGDDWGSGFVDDDDAGGDDWDV
jgi:hypothetical protein